MSPQEDSCNQFYKCANGTLTLETCGNGLLYDEARGQAGAAHNHCSYNWEADCGQRYRVKTWNIAERDFKLTLKAS